MNRDQIYLYIYKKKKKKKKKKKRSNFSKVDSVDSVETTKLSLEPIEILPRRFIISVDSLWKEQLLLFVGRCTRRTSKRGFFLTLSVRCWLSWMWRFFFFFFFFFLFRVFLTIPIKEYLKRATDDWYSASEVIREANYIIEHLIQNSLIDVLLKMFLFPLVMNCSTSKAKVLPRRNIKIINH